MPVYGRAAGRQRGWAPRLHLQAGPKAMTPVDLVDCELRRETFSDRSLVEAWFGVLKYRTLQFWHRFPYRSSVQSADRWTRAFALIHNALFQS